MDLLLSQNKNKFSSRGLRGVRPLFLCFSFLFAGCSGTPLPKLPPVFSLEAPKAELFPVNRRATLNYDTRTTGDATEVELNSILKRNLKGRGKTFLKYSRQYKVSARFAAAVAIAESGGSSRVSRKYSNYFGLMRGGRPISFVNADRSIEYFFQTIAKYHLKKKFTVIQIQKTYCPSGGEWRKNVITSMNKVGD